MGDAMRLNLRGLVSRSPEEQVEKLKLYFGEYLAEWHQYIMMGVRPQGNQAEILGELALAHARMAAASILSDPLVPDEVIEADAEELALKFIEMLINKMTMRHAEYKTKKTQDEENVS